MNKVRIYLKLSKYDNSRVISEEGTEREIHDLKFIVIMGPLLLCNNGALEYKENRSSGLVFLFHCLVCKIILP